MSSLVRISAIGKRSRKYRLAEFFDDPEKFERVAALLRQEFHNNQGNNHGGEHVDESSCGRDARNDGFTEETKQPVYGQDQNDQIKQGNLLLSGPDVTRLDIPGDNGSGDLSNQGPALAGFT